MVRRRRPAQTVRGDHRHCSPQVLVTEKGSDRQDQESDVGGGPSTEVVPLPLFIVLKRLNLVFANSFRVIERTPLESKDKASFRRGDLGTSCVSKVSNISARRHGTW